MVSGGALLLSASMLAMRIPEIKLWGVEHSALSEASVEASCDAEVRSASFKNAELEICVVVLEDDRVG